MSEIDVPTEDVYVQELRESARIGVLEGAACVPCRRISSSGSRSVRHLREFCQSRSSKKDRRISTSELLPATLLAIRCCLGRGIVYLPYVCQFLVDPLLFQLTGASISQVCNKRHESCARLVSRRPWSWCVEPRIPRIVGTLPVWSRLNSPPPALAAILEVTEAAMLVVVEEVVVVGGRFPPGR